MALLVSLTQPDRRRRGGCVARFTHYRVGRHVYATDLAIRDLVPLSSQRHRRIRMAVLIS